MRPEAIELCLLVGELRPTILRKSIASLIAVILDNTFEKATFLEDPDLVLGQYAPCGSLHRPPEAERYNEIRRF